MFLFAGKLFCFIRFLWEALGWLLGNLAMCLLVCMCSVHGLNWVAGHCCIAGPFGSQISGCYGLIRISLGLSTSNFSIAYKGEAMFLSFNSFQKFFPQYINQINISSLQKNNYNLKIFSRNQKNSLLKITIYTPTT